MRNLRRTSDEGFTLVELMVTIIILGVLAAIAIPHLLSQKEKAYTAAVRSDARSLAHAEEQFSSEHGGYTDVLADLIAEGGFRQSESTTQVDLATYTAGGQRAFCVVARHTPSGRTAWFASASATGGRVGAVTDSRPDTTNCPA